MKTTLHMAVSADGYIAKADGDSNWVSSIDEELFFTRVRESGCVVIGKRTYEQYKGSIYPVSGAINIVLSSQKIDSGDANIVYAGSPVEALKIAKEHGSKGVLVSGGAKVSSSFLKEDMLDEIFFTVHPILLGAGIKPFDGLSINKRLKLIDTRELGESLIELHYGKLSI